MTAIELYKFVSDNKLEYHYNNHDGEEDVILFIPNYFLDDFNKVLPESIFDSEGLECIMKDGYFCFWMDDICGYSGIELSEIFDKSKEQ